MKYILLVLLFSINSFAAINWVPESLVGTEGAPSFPKKAACNAAYGDCKSYVIGSEDAFISYKRIDIFGNWADDSAKKAAWDIKQQQKQDKKDAKLARKARLDNAKDPKDMTKAEQDAVMKDLLDERKG